MNRKEARFQEKLQRYKGPKRLAPAKSKPVARFLNKPWNKQHARRLEQKSNAGKLNV